MDPWIMYRNHLFSCPTSFQCNCGNLNIIHHRCTWASGYVWLCVCVCFFSVRAHKTYYSFISWHLGLVKWTHPTHPYIHSQRSIKTGALYVALAWCQNDCLDGHLHSRGLSEKWKRSLHYGGALRPLVPISMWLTSWVDGYISRDWWGKYLPRS